jgi:lipid-A-disaccharide synthase
VNGVADGTYPVIFLIAGEPSGDQLGARLMAALKKQTGGRIRFAGVGGERMEQEGIESIFPMEDLSVFGLAEVLRHAPRVLRRVRDSADAVKAIRPDVVVTIDVPTFSFRVAKKLRGAGIPLIHCVAPQVWAWRPRRARMLSRILDHLLVLLPFEPPFFESVGLPCTLIGHPIVELGADKGEGADFRVRHAIPPEAPVLCILPGSRGNEVSRLLPVFGRTLHRLMAEFPDLRGVVPVVSAVKQEVAAAVAGWPIPITLVEGEAEKYNAFAASTAALNASGTVTLELALAKVPTVVAYKLSPLTGWLGRWMVKVPYVTVVNLILGRKLLPEFIQQDCTPPLLAGAVANLLRDEPSRREQIDGTRDVLRQLGLGQRPPSELGAAVILRHVKGFEDGECRAQA